MRRQFFVALGLVGAFAASSAHALGLGAIRIDSRLNQPFAAEIPLLSVGPDQLETVRVRLADADEFRRLGIERADYLSDLRFELVPGATPVIRISSGQPARDPFLTFLLDVRSDSQRVLREYTVLLDPPPEAVSRGTVTARTPEAGPTLEPFPPARSEPLSTARPTAPVQTPSPTPAATPRPAVVLSTAPLPDPTKVPEATDAPAPTDAESESASRYGPIQPQETLWSIANAVRPDSASVNQTLLALYTANPTAFDRGRFDGLLRGVTLTVPPASVITQVDPVTARDRVLALRAGDTTAASAQSRVRATPRPTAAATPVPTATPTPTPTPTSTSTPTPSPTPLVGLTPSTDGSDSAAALSDPGAAPEATEPGPEVDAASSGVDAEQPSAAGDQIVDSELPEASETAIDEEETRPDAAPAPVVPAVEDDGLLDALLLPLVLVLVAGLIVGGVWWQRRRRAPAPAAPVAAPPALGPKAKAAGVAAAPSATDLADEAEAAVMAAFAGGRNEAAVPSAKTDDVDPQPDFLSDAAVSEDKARHSDAASADDLESTQIFSSPFSEARTAIPDTPEFSSTGQFQVDAVQMDLGNQDPAAEADIHMAYGLYDEAELTLNNALEKSPHRPEWLFKLAEVHFAAGRGLQFVETAERAKPHLSAADWQKLALLGRQVAPDNPLFADADDAAVMAADVDLSFDEPGTADSGSALRADVGQAVVTPVIEDPRATAAPEAPQAASAADPNELLPDLTLDTPSLDPATAIDPNALEFDLDDFKVDEAAAADPAAPVSRPPAETEAEDATANRGESLDFDLELTPMSPASAAASETAAAPPAEDDAANRLEFSLDDFDTPAASEAASAAAPPEAESRGEAIDFQLDSFDLDDSDAISSGDEAATKLDLARAYVDMGDKEMAQALLNEVLGEGNAQQQDEARALIARMA